MMVLGGVSKLFFISDAGLLTVGLSLFNHFSLAVVIPGIYGMTKIVKWYKKRQVLLRKQARGDKNADALIEEADNELEQ